MKEEQTGVLSNEGTGPDQKGGRLGSIRKHWIDVRDWAEGDGVPA